ncbi:MAG TPA: NADPH-dependent glutamate synthase [Propioniciclava tarda]|nr:NADPH-dependent glutamate synthase [Propioniciclava tarda]
MYKIVRREQFSDTNFLWEVEAPDVATSAEPGQFIMVRLHEGSERVPLTVADFDRERGTITLVVQALGKTTQEMRDKYREGEYFTDFVGPMGLPTHIRNEGHVVLVGGGLGVAPVFPQLRAYKQAGCKVTGIIGFRNKDLIFWEDRFKEFCDELIVCTDDGSYGRPGFVTQALREVVETEKPDLVVAIGPMPMMRACVETTRPYGTKTMVSLNSIMVDGTGMCGSCRVTVDGVVKFACVDGPDFDGHAVDFKELMVRQARFKNLEVKAAEAYDHVCKVEQELIGDGKRNYKSAMKVSPEQTPMPEADPHIRATNFSEVNLGYGMKEAFEEAERCIQCSNPKCVAGCPVSIDIPGFIRKVLVRDLNGALEVINESNLFPSICGRVCPQESQCEAQCIVRNEKRGREAVGIGRLERFVGDNAVPRRNTPPVVDEPLGRVAIVGSGPSGLAAAADLAKAGAEVVVYEALHVVGGVLQYGIPSFRLPREIITREVQGLRDLGVQFDTNKIVGKTFTIDKLMQDRGFDAVYVATGAGAPSFLGIPGEHAGQVLSANEFLTRINLMGGNKFPYLDTPVSQSQSVIVIGAGNTAMDCLRVAKRVGVPKVTCVYRRSEAEAPARIEELRHAKEEGIEFRFLHAPVEIRLDDEGNVTAMKTEVCELGEPDDKGRRRPVGTGVFEDIECDTVIYALGTNANPIIAQSTPDLALNKWGYIIADDDTQATNKPGVFAGGDIVTGGATVILAMGSGRRAAKSIGAFLASGKSLEGRTWPVTSEMADAFVPPTAPQVPASPEVMDAVTAALGSDADAKAAAAAGSVGAVEAPKPEIGATPEETPLPAASMIEAQPTATATVDQEESVTICPRCHRPIEGSEQYICCAGDTLQWKCTQCGKVSEGFAFPYGQCPMCQGKLVRDAGAGPVDESNERAMEAIRTAFEIELGGGAYYRKAATEASDPALKDLFQRMSEMEDEHLDTLTRRYHAEVPAPSPDFETKRAAIFAGLEHQPDDPANLLKLAIGFEKRAVAFFEGHVAECPEGSVERELYEELAAEEREHVDMLTDELNRFLAGKGGVL